jgi:hypothetical protein
LAPSKDAKAALHDAQQNAPILDSAGDVPSKAMGQLRQRIAAAQQQLSLRDIPKPQMLGGERVRRERQRESKLRGRLEIARASAASLEEGAGGGSAQN